MNEINDPVVRMLSCGVNTISDNEILSLLIAGNDSKERSLNVLTHIKYQYSELAKLNYSQLRQHSLSHLQAIKILSVIEFSRRK